MLNFETKASLCFYRIKIAFDLLTNDYDLAAA